MADAKKRSDSPELFGKTAALALCVCLLAGSGQTRQDFGATGHPVRAEPTDPPDDERCCQPVGRSLPAGRKTCRLCQTFVAGKT